MKNKSLIILKELNIKHVSKHYVDWLNDKTTMMFTEQRFKKHTFADVKSFVLKNLILVPLNNFNDHINKIEERNNPGKIPNSLITNPEKNEPISP